MREKGEAEDVIEGGVAHEKRKRDINLVCSLLS